MKDYYVTMKVAGEFIAHVTAETETEAKEKGIQAYTNADFGELSEIDSDVVNIEEGDGSDVDWIAVIEEKGVAYEQGEMLREDSEVEIDECDGEIWLCDYSSVREGAEFIEKICNTDDIDMDKLEAMCFKHDWGYVL